jgi:serine/threonine protein kinase
MSRARSFVSGYESILFPDDFEHLMVKARNEHDKLFDYTYEDILHLKQWSKTKSDDSEVYEAVDEKLKGDIGPIPDATIDAIFKEAKKKGGYDNAISVVRIVLSPFIDELSDIKDSDIDLTGKVVLANKLGNSVGSALVFHGYVKRNGIPELIVVKGFNILHNIAEVEIGIKCNHPNVIKPLGIACMNIRFAKMACQVLPLFPYTSLEDYLNKNEGADRLKLLGGIAKGLQYLHRNNISHNDLKSDNVFVTRDGVPVISDFGNGRFLYNFFTNVGTPTTVSPEINAHALITEKADMFALGRIYEQLLSNFKTTYLIPQTVLKDEKFYVNIPNQLDDVVEKEIDPFKDEASDAYKKNFTFLYGVDENIKEIYMKNKKANTFQIQQNITVFVSKYEEECNNNLPFTNLKYLLKKDSSFDYKGFYDEIKRRKDPIFYGLLQLNPAERWSANQLLKELGYEFTEYNKEGTDLPYDFFTENPKKNIMSVNFISTFKKDYRVLDCYIFYNRFDSRDDFEKIIRTDVNDIQEQFENYKKLNYNVLPKYFDPNYFKKKAELNSKFLWLYRYALSHREYFYGNIPPESSSGGSIASYFTKLFVGNFY